MNRLFRFPVSVLAIAVMASSMLLAQPSGTVALRILHYNDFHAQNVPMSVTSKGENGEKATIEVGGLAFLKAYIDKLKAEQPNSILLHAGDDFQGTPASTITKGRSQIELLELMQPDVMTLGNHEFDYGAANVRQLLPLATFPIVSANLFDKSQGAPFLPRYRVLHMQGMTIGVIGMAPPDLKRLTLRENVKDLDVLDAEKTIRQTMHELKTNFHADLIVVLSHMGIEVDTVIARAVPGIDVIVGGHSHTALFKPLHINDTWVAQAGSKGRYLGKLDLQYDPAAHRVASASGSLVEVRTKGVTPDPVIAAKVAEYEAIVSTELSAVIGELVTDWRRSGGAKESNVGNWMSDVIRKAAKADIGMQNSGGIRKDLAAGPITSRDVWEISPFSNQIVTFTVTGEQLLKALSTQGRKAREFCQVSGVRYRYDRTLPENKALSATVDGKPVNPKKKYKIATNSYVGGHLFDFFELPEAQIEVKPLEPETTDRDLFIEAIKKQKRIDAKLDGRIEIAGD
jgi:5'-nucleotidase / UDP-sugar diphosphatase